MTAYRGRELVKKIKPASRFSNLMIDLSLVSMIHWQSQNVYKLLGTHPPVLSREIVTEHDAYDTYGIKGIKGEIN